MQSEAIKEVMKTIPKEYHKAINKIVLLARKEGVMIVQSLIDDITNIPPSDINDYGVYHDDCLDGG